MFLLTYVLSRPEKLFFQATVFAIVGFYLLWLFTEAPECNSFATDCYVPMPGSWNFPTASDISCQENEDENIGEGDFNDPCLDSPENSKLSADSSVFCLLDTNSKSVISETIDNEESSALLFGPIIVVDSVLEPNMGAPKQVLNVEMNGGETHKGKSTKANKKVGSKAKKAIEASEILAELLLDSPLPKKANCETKKQGKTSRKNKGKCKGKRNAKAATKTKETKESSTEEVWPEIEAEDSSDVSEPETFASKNPFFVLSGLDENKYQTFSRSHKLVAKKLDGVEPESTKIGELSGTIESTSSTPVGAEETTASFQPVLPILAFDSCMTSLSATSPTPTTPETPETPRTPRTSQTPEAPETPEIPETPETPKTPNTPETLGTPTTPDTPETPQTIDEDGFDFEQLIKERKRNGSPSREYRQTFKNFPVLIPLKDTAQEWRKASSPSRCSSPVKSGSSANESGWHVVGKRQKQPLTWAQVAADSTPDSTITNSPRLVAKTISKENKSNVVVLLKRKPTLPT